MERDCKSKKDLVEHIDFNPLSPCGERPHCDTYSVPQGQFQPTLSVWRETSPLFVLCRCISISTHSLRVERDEVENLYRLDGMISTHSLRVERDLCVHALNLLRQDFNPLSPCGERLQKCLISPMHFCILTTNSNPKFPNKIAPHLFPLQN